MRDITYCTSRYCKFKKQCQRHCDNNNLVGRIYSASDFTNKDEDKCVFYIEDGLEYAHGYRCEYCDSPLTGMIQIGQYGLGYIHCNSCGQDSYNDGLKQR